MLVPVLAIIMLLYNETLREEKLMIIKMTNYFIANHDREGDKF